MRRKRPYCRARSPVKTSGNVPLILLRRRDMDLEYGSSHNAPRQSRTETMEGSPSPSAILIDGKVRPGPPQCHCRPTQCNGAHVELPRRASDIPNVHSSQRLRETPTHVSAVMLPQALGKVPDRFMLSKFSALCSGRTGQGRHRHGHDHRHRHRGTFPHGSHEGRRETNGGGWRR